MYEPGFLVWFAKSNYFVFRTGNGTLAEPTITPDQRPAQKINPIGTFRAKSECTGLTQCDKVTFEWFMGCLAIDLVPPIDYKNMDNYENITLDDDPEIQPNVNLRVNRKKGFCFFYCYPGCVCWYSIHTMLPYKETNCL